MGCTQFLAPAIVAGLSPPNGIDTGNIGGRQSMTVSPAISAGFCSVRSGPSPTASANSRFGCVTRCWRLTDFGVDTLPVCSEVSSPSGDGRSDRIRVR